MNWERLREKVIDNVYPSKEELEEINEKYEEISQFIEKEYDVETHFAGSASRKTCMKGDNDIDLFVLFPEDTDKEKLENKGLKIGKDVFDHFNGEYQIEYAEHPYTKGMIDGREVEIVPCYDTDPENIKSSVDRTPHHSRWVENNLSDEERKDVVILKKFLDVAGIYGSSLKTEGFSGYLCEILINEYGGFKDLVFDASNWRRKEVIDPEEHHEELPQKLKTKFKDEDLVVIDPVDPERNVASVLSSENYAKFVYLCWEFRQEPGLDFFTEEEIEFTEFEIRQEVDSRGDFIVLEFPAVEEVEDIVYPQMRKTMRRLEQLLTRHDFRVFESGFHVSKPTRIFFEVERELPENKKQYGPSIFHGHDHLGEFVSKYDNVFIEGDRLVAKTEREFSDAKKFLKEFLEEDLEEKGIPSQIAENLENYSFSEIVVEDEKWLNYLGEKLHVEKR